MIHEIHIDVLRQYKLTKNSYSSLQYLIYFMDGITKAS